jgi:hypothetical protein
MARFEKFLQLWNGHDVASRDGAVRWRHSAHAECERSLHATPLIVFICPYHIMGPGPTRSFVDNSVFTRFFGAVSAGHAGGQWLTSPKITTLWGHGLGEKWGSEKKNFRFFSRNFSASSQHNIVDTRGLRRQPKRGGPISYRFRVMGGQKFSPKKF